MDNKNSSGITLLVSAVVGALVGLGVGTMLIKRADENEGSPTITAGEGVSLGLMVLGLLRQVASLSDGD